MLCRDNLVTFYYYSFFIDHLPLHSENDRDIVTDSKVKIQEDKLIKKAIT